MKIKRTTWFWFVIIFIVSIPITYYNIMAFPLKDGEISYIFLLDIFIAIVLIVLILEQLYKFYNYLDRKDRQ